MPTQQKPVALIQIPLPPAGQQVGRAARPAGTGEKRNRYTLPESLESPSPVGFRTRVSLRPDEANAAMALLSMERPRAFEADAAPPTEQRLFEESSLGVLSARQSTNFRGQRQVSLGPEDSARACQILQRLPHLEAAALDHATHTHILLARPYRTPFTFLLTFVGHSPLSSLFTVPQRAWNKRFKLADDIPTNGYLTHLHVGILADAVERAAVLASGGTARAQVFMAPFSGPERQEEGGEALAELEALAGLDKAQRAEGWRIALVAQVGQVAGPPLIDAATCRRLGAALLGLRSERIQPGVNQEPKAPEPYQHRQDMHVPEDLTVMAGRAAYNAFCHWTGADRAQAKELLLLDRIDVLTDGGKERLRQVRRELEAVTGSVVRGIPLWADLPTGRALSRNAARGKKAFALAGQRIYIGGLARPEVAAAGLGWDHAVRAFGAAASRSALVAEICGSTEIPEGCDLLAGICLMAGPVNQNDIGKAFFGFEDLLSVRFKGRDPTSLLVWTLKAKTVGDPVGNEQQLMSAAHKGALVDLRAGPHEVCLVRTGGAVQPMRQEGSMVSQERAFGDVGNFIVGPKGTEIAGNRGVPWPAELSQKNAFS